MRKIIFLAPYLLLAGVKVDFDKAADFSQYKTYSWIVSKGPAKAPATGWTDSIAKDVDAQLARKGWTRIQSGGDLVVSAFGRTRDGQTLQTFYTDYGGEWKWQRVGDTTRTANDTAVGTLVVDVFDGASKKLLWTSSSTEILLAKPDKSKLNESIVYMFRDFPRQRP